MVCVAEGAGQDLLLHADDPAHMRVPTDASGNPMLRCVCSTRRSLLCVCACPIIAVRLQPFVPSHAS